MKLPLTCKHFNGIQHDCCAAGVDYKTVRDASHPGPYRWPCLSPSGRVATTVCEKREYPTPEETRADEERFEKAFAAIASGRSPCCDAPLDESHVNAKGTGFRFCSKCKAMVFHGLGQGEYPDD